jgi:galactosylgalactosylxylosylprotein 3-beta-glucuronosyltransferase 3
MNGEVSIRVRKKHFILFCLSLSFILFLIVRSGSNSAASDCVQRDRTELFTDNNRLPIIYAITPTYSRPVQKAELTR